MYTHHKLWILSALLLISGSLAYAGTTIIKVDPDHIVQSIEKIFFTKTGHPSDDEILMYSRQGVLHISGSFQAASSGSKFSPRDNQSTLIGGESNEGTGTNISLIGGKYNKILSGNNAVILGGGYNTIGKRGETLSNVVIAGGRNNIVRESNNTIIGGRKNTITGSGNIALGAIDSTINGNNNTIIGSHITIPHGVNNIFAWSDNKQRTSSNKKFEPNTSDTFYLRAENGVGINTNDPQATLDVAGLVQIGDEPGACTDTRKGTMIFRNGCFYACSDGENWDNLAGTQECATGKNGEKIKTISFSNAVDPSQKKPSPTPSTPNPLTPPATPSSLPKNTSITSI